MARCTFGEEDEEKERKLFHKLLFMF